MKIRQATTRSSITVKDSIVAGTAAYSSATIFYLGNNLARKTSAELTVNAPDVFTAHTSSSLVKVSDHNYVAPIVIDGPAYKKVDTVRSLNASQNGVVHKSPLSDLGAYEHAATHTLSYDANGATGGISPVDQLGPYEEGASETNLGGIKESTLPLTSDEAGILVAALFIFLGIGVLGVAITTMLSRQKRQED